MAAIDVGSAAIDRTAFYTYNQTIIDKANPANLSGKITSVELWAKAALSGAVVGTFYETGTNKLKCRDSESVGSVAAGSKQTKSGLDITVEAGDYIGIYFTAGQIEASYEGYTDVWGITGQYIDPGDETTYYDNPGAAMSVYGIGVSGVSVTIDVPLATVSGQAYAPTMSLGRTIDVPVATVSGEAFAPSLVRDMILSPPLAAVSAEALPPEIIAGYGVIISVPLAAVSSEAHAPSLSLDKVISVPLATVASEAFAPSLVRDMIIAIPLALVTGQAHGPSLGLDMVLAVPLALVSAEALPALLSLGVSVDVPLAEVDAQAYVPRVLNMRIQEAVRSLAAFRVLNSIREEERL